MKIFIILMISLLFVPSISFAMSLEEQIARLFEQIEVLQAQIIKSIPDNCSVASEYVDRQGLRKDTKEQIALMFDATPDCF